MENSKFAPKWIEHDKFEFSLMAVRNVSLNKIQQLSGLKFNHRADWTMCCIQNENHSRPLKMNERVMNCENYVINTLCNTENSNDKQLSHLVHIYKWLYVSIYKNWDKQREHVRNTYLFQRSRVSFQFEMIRWTCVDGVVVVVATVVVAPDCMRNSALFIIFLGGLPLEIHFDWY